MKNLKFLIGTVLAVALMVTQFADVFAAAPTAKVSAITGSVSEVTLETDSTTGIITVIVTVVDSMGVSQTVRISEKSASKLGLIDYDSADGNPFIVQPLPSFIEVNPKMVISDDDKRHPVGSALATFFSDIEGLDYDTIMDARADGNGFGLIAHALWLVQKMGGTAEDFVALLDAKKNKNFEDFPLADGTIPATWGELIKAVADKNLGLIVSQKDKKDHGNDQRPVNSSNVNNSKDKAKDKPNNGKSNENGNGKDNGNGKGNGNKP